MSKDIYYSDKYFDEKYEYRHVMLPRELSKLVPKSHLMSEAEWRSIGVQQSQGWIHYMKHEPERDRTYVNDLRLVGSIKTCHSDAVHSLTSNPSVLTWSCDCTENNSSVKALGIEKFSDALCNLK